MATEEATIRREILEQRIEDDIRKIQEKITETNLKKKGKLMEDLNELQQMGSQIATAEA